MENNDVIMVEEQSDDKKMNIPFILRIVGVIALLITVISVGTGLYKLYAYENPYDEEYMVEEDMFDEEKAVNAYNYLDVQNIEANAGLATAYFTLAILFIIIGIASFALAELVKRNEKILANKQAS